MIVLLGALMYVYFLYNKERKTWRKHREVLHESANIVEDAHARANKLVEQAVEKAGKTISEGEYLREDLVKNFEKDLEKVAETMKGNLSVDEKSFEQAFQTFAESLRAEYLKKVDATLASIDAQAQKEIQDFRSSVEKATLDSQSNLQKNISGEFEKAQAEIKAYQDQQMKTIDQAIENVLQKVAQDVLSRSLTLEDHQQLIIDSLEKAKKEEFFEKGMTIEKGKG